jgi:hypothetical protein
MRRQVVSHADVPQADAASAQATTQASAPATTSATTELSDTRG